MTLRDLSREQWDAALEAARVLTTCSPYRADDRAQFRAAKAKLAALLPEGGDVNAIITQAVHRDMLDGIATVCAGLPVEGAV